MNWTFLFCFPGWRWWVHSYQVFLPICDTKAPNHYKLIQPIPPFKTIPNILHIKKPHAFLSKCNSRTMYELIIENLDLILNSCSYQHISSFPLSNPLKLPYSFCSHPNGCKKRQWTSRKRKAWKNVPVALRYGAFHFKSFSNIMHTIPNSSCHKWSIIELSKEPLIKALTQLDMTCIHLLPSSGIFVKYPIPSPHKYRFNWSYPTQILGFHTAAALTNMNQKWKH